MFIRVAVDYLSNVSLKAIKVDSCEGTIVFVDDKPVLPQIFDIKYQTYNGKYVRPDYPPHNYLLTNQGLSVSAIVDSPIIPLKRAELKVISIGSDDYSATTSMNITSLSLPFDESNSTSFVSVLVPSVHIHWPAVEFWIVVVTEDGLVQESKHHTVGVKPFYPIAGSVEMDSMSVKAQGASLRPSAYVINNAVGPIYATINLLIDGRPVYSESGIFESGITKKDLKWNIPKSQSPSRYDIQTSLQMYDLTYLTDKATFNSFARTQLVPLSEQVLILPITDELGNVIARPGLLYSSNSANENFRFHVTAPDGTCVIGSESDCLVKESTKSYRGGLESIVIDGEIFRVRYSGPDNPLERFSITSYAPIIGNWSVQLEEHKIFGQSASAQTDGWLKIKYRTENNRVVTVSSN